MSLRPILCTIMLLAAITVHADDAFVHRVIVDAFPTVTARIVAIDSRTGEQVSLNGADVRVFENGVMVGSTTVSCPPTATPLPLSSVLAIDVSGSMAYGAPNITLARAAARAWIEALPTGSECAITSFDDKHYINADFTDDAKHLNATLDAMKPKGGTNFSAGFLGEPYGALRIASTGTKRRVLVFLTDGQGFGRALPVIEQALRDSVTVYCVSLGLTMPPMLREVAEATNGLWFENVTTIEEAVSAYRRILTIATGAGACDVQWRSAPSCETDRALTLIIRGDTIRTSYRVPEAYRVTLSAAPSSIDFKVLRSSTSTTQEVVLKATGRSILVTGIDNDRRSPFTVDAPAVPFEIPAGEAMRIAVRYTPVDSLYAYGRMTIRTDACGDVHLDAMAGSRDLNPSRPTLRVVSPNGGETIPGGMKVKLRYDGVPMNEPIRLDVSTDKGRTWQFVTSFAKNHMIEWRAPVVDSDSCLLRATHERNAIPESRMAARSNCFGIGLQDIALADNSMWVATMGRRSRADSTPVVRIHDARTGDTLRSIVAGGTGLTWIDSTSVIAWGRTEVTRFNAATGERSWTIPLRGNRAPHLVHVQGDRTTIVGGIGDSVQVVSTSSGAQARLLSRGGIDVKWARTSHDGSWLALGELDSSLTIQSLTDRSAPTTISIPGSRGFLNAAFTSDGDRLVVTTRSGKALLLDRASGKVLLEYPHRSYINDNGYLAISPNDGQLVMETGRDSTSILDLETGERLVVLQRGKEPSGPFSARFTEDGTRVLLSSVIAVTIFDAGSGARINRYNRFAGEPSLSRDGRLIATIGSEDFSSVYDLFGSPLQTDVSDAVWRIVKAGGVLKDIGFAVQYANTQKDSIVRGAIRNTGRYPFTVSSLRLEGVQAQEFLILTTGPFLVQPGDSLPIEYAFVPRGAGIRSCNIYAETDIGTFRARMSGRAIMPDLSLNADHVDFGVVRVGRLRELQPERLIRNVGRSPIQITSITLNGPDDGSFTIIDDKPFTLAPNESRSIPLSFHPSRRGRTSSSLLITAKGAAQAFEVTLHGEGVDTIIRLMDPTTFRSIILPSAVIPPPGTVTTGVYDLLGLQAGVSVHEHVMILAGGTLPFNSAWFGAETDRASFSAAYSIGAKCGFTLGEEWIAGGGYQFGQSVYDKESTPEFESRITYNALWTTIGYGDDDSRINAYLGYAFKHHVTAYEGTFDADATIVGLAGDYRIAEQWKICGEGFFMRTMTFVPITLTARYFTTWYALEAGVTITAIPASGAAASGSPVIPMLTWVARW